MIEDLRNNLQEFFITPEALILSAAVFLLIIFYLKKPEPNKQLMPSIKFFHEGKADGRLRNTLQRLKSNIFLILHLLILGMLVLAVAEPFEWQEGEQEHRVLILDNSATTQQNFGEYKSYLQNNLAEKNTLIKMGDETEILAEQVSPRTANNKIENIDPKPAHPDMRDAIETAAEYDAEIIVSSNFGGESYNEITNSLESTNQQFQVIDKQFKNSWGIIDVRREGENTVEAVIRNYQSDPATIDLRHNDEAYEISIESESTESIEIDLKEGENVIELEEDEFAIDNTLYIQNNQSETKAVYSSNEHDDYILAALEVQNSLGEVIKADKDDVPSELDLLITGEPVQDISAPQIVKSSNQEFFGPEREAEATLLTDSDDINLGEVRYKELNQDYEGITEPRDIVFTDSENSKAYINIISEDIKNKPFYPLIWKQTIRELIETNQGLYQDVESTGQQPGFHNGEAYNLLGEFEPFTQEIEAPNYAEIEKTRESHQNLLIKLIAGLIAIEILLLRKIGVI